MRLLWIFILVIMQKSNPQDTGFMPQKAWVIKNITIKRGGGWHSVVDVMDIIDFSNDSLLTVKYFGIGNLQLIKYKIDQNGRFRLSDGSKYQIKFLTHDSLVLTCGNSTFTYTPLKDTKGVAYIDIAINNLLNNVWSYDSVAHKQKLEFTMDKFFVDEVDSGLMRFRETPISKGSEKNEGGWIIENYKNTLLLTILSNSSYESVTYQIDEFTEDYIKAIGWQNGYYTIIKLYRL